MFTLIISFVFKGSLTERVKATLELAKYLESKGIEYKNEYSDAGWAYRFVINKDVETHNELLNSFTL